MNDAIAVRLTWADSSAQACSTALRIAYGQYSNKAEPAEAKTQLLQLVSQAETLCRAILAFNQEYNPDWDAKE